MQEILKNTFCKWIIVSFLLIYAAKGLNDSTFWNQDWHKLFVIPTSIVWLVYLINLKNKFFKWVIVSFLLVYASKGLGDLFEFSCYLRSLPTPFVTLTGVVWLVYLIKMIAGSSVIKTIKSYLRFRCEV